MTADLAERSISTRRSKIDIIREVLPTRLAVGTANNILMNYRGLGEAHINIGLVQWRRGEDPRSEFTAGLDAIEKGIAEAVARHAGPEDIDQLNLHIAQPIAYLMDRTLTVLNGSAEQLEDFPTIAAGFLLADALFDRPYKDRLPSVIKALASKKRQMLALLTFQTYFGLLDAAGDPARIAELAAEGDANYLRRKKNVFYSQGAVLSAGGDDNDILLDWQLAAVLKKVGFQGESPNRWRWD
jgi:hypothetical protein